MTEGSLVEWIKKDGEAVRVGDVICTIEGDKAVNEVESMDSGVLRIPPDSPPPGEKVPVGTVLAYLVQAGERAPFEGDAPRPLPPPPRVGEGPPERGRQDIAATTLGEREPRPESPLPGGEGQGEGERRSRTDSREQASFPLTPALSRQERGERAALTPAP